VQQIGTTLGSNWQNAPSRPSIHDPRNTLLPWLCVTAVLGANILEAKKVGRLGDFSRAGVVVKLTRATLLRVLLAVALATMTGVGEGRADDKDSCRFQQSCPQPGPGSPGGGGSDSNNRVIWYVVGGIVAAVIGWAIKTQVFPDQPDPRTLPGQPPLVQLPPTPPAPPAPPLSGPPGGGGPAGPTGQALRRGFDLPEAGAPFVPNEIILDIPATVPTATLDAMAARHGMTRLESVTIRLTGRTLHRWRLASGSPLDMLRNVSATERLAAGGQVNFLYALAQDDAVPVNADQYAPQKLNLSEAHRLARGSRILIAVIDSEIDASHPDLSGAINANFEASADDERPHSHGTGMAGAIAARRNMLGVAPRAALLAVRAFSMRADSAEGTTFNILKGLDWAAAQGARIVNMSFAGPSDPRLREALGKANKKGIVLIAAAGNAGPNSPPLYPAADPSVIAVTATDADDKLFPGANRGSHVAVAAPGVDILAPAPGGGYQLTTGTSVAAAEVSGAAALLLERNPALTPAEVKKILMDTAKDLGPKGRDRDFGAGLVNALQAVTVVRPR
jgi:subtilase family protein